MFYLEVDFIEQEPFDHPSGTVTTLLASGLQVGDWIPTRDIYLHELQIIVTELGVCLRKFVFVKRFYDTRYPLSYKRSSVS